jgi:hypothetical protein
LTLNRERPYSPVDLQQEEPTILENSNPDNRTEVLQGTLDLMVLKTLEAMGPLHGYGVARRIEQVFCGWNRADGSARSGAFPTTTGARSITRSQKAG